MQDFAPTPVISQPVETVAKPPSLLENVKSSTFAKHITSLRLKKIFNLKKMSSYLFFVIVGIAVLLGLRVALSKAIAPAVSQKALETPVSTTHINREFSFSVYDKNKIIGDPVRYILADVQLTKQIIIKGQRANAVKGRQFLIINLKLINDFNNSLFLNTRNYIRVQPAGSQDRLAADIHNDTVEVQPLSTKLTRIGLPVDENIKEFTLFVGELEGTKEAITIKF